MKSVRLARLHAVALALLAGAIGTIAPAQLPPVAKQTERPASDYIVLYPGRYTPREAELLRKWFAANQALETRGPIDVRALVAGTLPQDTPGLGPVIKVTEEWVRYNNQKYDPESRLRSDAAYARSLGFRDILVYPTFGAHDDTFMIPVPAAARDRLLVSELNHSVTSYEPIYPGDTLYLVADRRQVLDLTPPEGSTYRSLAIETRGSVYNQHGRKVNDVVFRVTENVRQYAREGLAPKNPGFMDVWEGPEWMRRPVRFYTDEDWAFIKGIWAKETRRGATPLHWEDVKVGEQPAWTLEGPIDISVSPIPPWGMGAGGSRTLQREIMDPAIFATMIRGASDGIWRLPDRDDRVPPTPKSDPVPGAPPAGGIDTRDIHKEGAARSILVNYMGRDMAIRHLMNWAGDRAWLETLKWSIMEPRALAAVGKSVPANPLAEHFLDRVPSMKGKYVDTHGLTGDVAIIKSEVVGKSVRDGKFLVDLVWWIEAIDGSIWEEGAATLRLPSKHSE